MGKEKHGFLTPKAIGNRIKAKGLQKLRWYCQMCQKQCRDENGFKCHVTSESHQRQLLLVADNPDKFVDTFSKDFCDSFIELVSRRFGTKRVHGNVVYQEYISDRNHIHMNSTQWETLTEFVKWIGREGYCNVDETEKGWFIQYIDRNPEAIRRQEALSKKVKMDLDDEERRNKIIQQQISRASSSKANNVDCSVELDKGLQKESEDDKVIFKIPAAPEKNKSNLKILSNSNIELKLNKSSKNLDHLETASMISSSFSTTSVKRKCALDEIMEMEEQKKAKIGRKDYWLTEGIIVKIITNKLGEQFYKKKAVIKEVFDKYMAVVKLLETGDKIKLDQIHLETVLPSLGKQVQVINGAYRGSIATLKSIEENLFSCTIVMASGPLKGRILNNIPYEDISKLHQP